jgi:hypothetical protein
MFRVRLAISTSLFLFAITSVAQLPFQIPSINEFKNGHQSLIEVPSLKDYKNFSKDYKGYLAMLDRRGEKAYRKSFLKFVAVEDELLLSLCDSNEYKANMLMRSSMASFGKIEADKHRRTLNQQKSFNQTEESIDLVASVSHELIPDLDSESLFESVSDHDKKTEKHGSNLYSDYMQKRVRIYKESFKEGTKQQKKLLRKLKKRAALWKAYKAEDKNLMSRFAHKNHSMMKFMETTPEFKEGMGAMMPDYSGTHGEKGFLDPGFDKTAFIENLKRGLVNDGTFSEQEVEKLTSVEEIFKKTKEKTKPVELPDTLKIELDNDMVQVDKVKTQRFWDRLYGGIDFDWENSTGYYPDGLGITLSCGYKISNNSGLAIEGSSVLNASKMGWSEDQRFDNTLFANYTLGANIDYRIWKFIFLGAGVEGIANIIEATTDRIYHDLKDDSFTLGVPIILRLLLPVAGANSTSVEFRYDLNSQNNIKPTFDFKLGFTIGRK